MTKIIFKKDIDIEQLKCLLSDDIRPILVGEFNDEEVKLYHSMGVYDIASTEEEAEDLVKDPADFKEVIDNNDVQYEEVEHEVKIQKPGLFSKPVKVALASLAVFGIAGATITALGLRNNVVKGEDVTLKSNETTDSKATSVKFTVSDLIVLTEANEENALIDTKGTEQKVIASYSDAEVKVDNKESEKEIKTKQEVKSDGSIEYTTPNGETVATVSPDGVLEIGDQKYDASNVNMEEYEFVVVEDETDTSDDIDTSNVSTNNVGKTIEQESIPEDNVNTSTDTNIPANANTSAGNTKDESMEQEEGSGNTNIVLSEEIKTAVDKEAEENAMSAEELKNKKMEEIKNYDAKQMPDKEL